MEQEEHSITFYNIQDDIPIGGFAKVGNEVYKVVNSNGNCSYCDFNNYEISNYEDYCKEAKCSPTPRADKIYVSFILYDTIPEDNDE